MWKRVSGYVGFVRGEFDLNLNSPIFLFQLRGSSTYVDPKYLVRERFVNERTSWKKIRSNKLTAELGLHEQRKERRTSWEGTSPLVACWGSTSGEDKRSSQTSDCPDCIERPGNRRKSKIRFCWTFSSCLLQWIPFDSWLPCPKFLI